MYDVRLQSSRALRGEAVAPSGAYVRFAKPVTQLCRIRGPFEPTTRHVFPTTSATAPHFPRHWRAKFLNRTSDLVHRT